MKKHIKNILSALFLTSILIFSACNNVLDVPDLEGYPEEGTFENQVTANAYLTNLYANTLSGWPVNMGNFADESVGIYGPDWITANAGPDQMKVWRYNNIRNINILLKEMTSSSLKNEIKDPMIAQAKFLRAFEYFKMLNLYGGIPYIKTVQSRDDDLMVKRNSTKECFDFIINDINESIAGLPDKYTGNNRGRIDKASALAFKGRVLLYKASPLFNPQQPYSNTYWKDAYNATKAAYDTLTAKGYGLLDNYTAVFETKGHKENILSIIYINPSKTNGRQEDAVRPLSESKNMTGADQPIWSMVQAYPMKDGKKIGDPTSAYTYNEQQFWLNRDPRFEATIAWNGAVYELSATKGRRQYTMYPIANSVDAFGKSIPGESSTRTGLYCRKGILENLPLTEVTLNDVDWTEIRFAEVLLNYAEAANENGYTDVGYSVIKDIRKRAGIESGTNEMYGLKNGMSKAEMRQALLDERFIEMAFEGRRFWDLRRHRMYNTLNGMSKYGVLATEVNGRKEPSQEDINKGKKFLLLPEHFTYEIANIADVYGSTGSKTMYMPDNYLFFPIPLNHIEKNKNLEQNKDWGGTFNPEL